MEKNANAIKKRNSTNEMDFSVYLYASSRLKSLEAKIITKDKFDKMIDAKSLADATAVLAECEYGDESSLSDGTVSYEKLFIDEQKKVYNLITEISPVPELLSFFQYQNDCHNIKSILKSEFMGREADDILVDLGTVDTATAKIEVRERTFRGFPENMAEAAHSAIDAFSKNRDPMMIDIIMDKACFADMFEIAEKSGCAFLRGLIRKKIDLVNIMITIRILRMKNTLDLLEKTLIAGGSMDMSFYREVFEGQEDKLYDALRYTEYSAVTEFAETNQGQVTLSRLEKLCEELYFAKIRETRFIPYGAEVIIGYIASKEMEIKNARIVMCGKETELAGDVIRERLRAVYA